MKGSSVLQNISQGMGSLQKGCANLFYSQVGRSKLCLQKLNKGTLVYSQAEGQGPPGKPLSMIIMIKASQRNSCQYGFRIGFLPATPLNLPSIKSLECLKITNYTFKSVLQNGRNEWHQKAKVKGKDAPICPGACV